MYQGIDTLTSMLWVGIVALAVIVVLGADLVRTPYQAVSRSRLEKFARRQMLTITSGNGNLVIRYLATTRRWRGSGLLLGLVVMFVLSWWSDGRTQINTLGMFAGWFVGAVIAEWRLGWRGRDGDIRTASLLPRRAADYLPSFALIVAGTAFVAVLGVELSAATMADRRSYALQLCALIVVTVLVGAAIVLVARHVLHRPQRVAEADVLAADDALRSRSLHVLAGSGLAIAGYLLSLAMDVASRSHSFWSAGWASFGTAVGIMLLPLLGLLTATATFVPRRRLPRVAVSR